MLTKYLFKAGELARAVDCEPYHKSGTVVKIERPNDRAGRGEAVYVRDNRGMELTHFSTRFKPISGSADWLVGDIVEAVDGDSLFPYAAVGDKFRITAIRKNYGAAYFDLARLTDGMKLTGWLPSRFKLLPHDPLAQITPAKAEPLPEFPNATRIVCTSRDAHRYITVGKEYVVQRQGYGKGFVFIVNDEGLSCQYETKYFEIAKAKPVAVATPWPVVAQPSRGKTWIIASEIDGKLAPNKPPREYSSDKQARRVAREMADKHRGTRFVILEAVGEVTVPKSEATIVSY